MESARDSIPLDLDSPVPIYAQIAEGIRSLVARSYWKPGDKIPSVRELAIKLEINPMTVVKAYELLEKMAVVEVRKGLGVFVSTRPLPLARKEQIGRVRHDLRKVIEEAKMSGVPAEEVRKTFRELMDKIFGGTRPLQRAR